METKEQKFYQALQDVFIGATIEGQGGFVNLMKIKSNYYSKIEKLIKEDIKKALMQYPDFRNELFDKLYSFFSRYFSESGSIYFNSTPFHNNVYEKVYTDEKDVILFWKTHMLYYVKTDRIFKSMEIEVDGFKFHFDVSELEHKKSNEKRNLIYELKEVRKDKTLVFNVLYSERGRKTKQNEILSTLKKEKISIDEEVLEKAFRTFEKQSEVDFFINKNAKAFLQEQFKLWSYQYFWDGAKKWTADRVNELQILKDIAFKIIDFISQFEDELVKIWNKPKFVKNSNYVITLDRIWELSESKSEKELAEFPSDRGVSHRDGVLTNTSENNRTKWYEIPYNPALKERARELRKAGNLSEVLFWQQVKGKQFLGHDFDRQKIIGNYIVDFFIKDIGVIVEIDGNSHDNKEKYDNERDEYFKSLGLHIIHLRDEDVKNDINGVMGYVKECIEGFLTPRQTSSDTPLKEGNLIPLTPLKEGNLTPLTPLQEGNLVKKIIIHPNIQDQIKEWQELGIVDDLFSIDDIIENDLMGEHLSEKYQHLPIDTKYFKDLEIKILSLFDDLDNSLDGWLIKSENYQALNTILPKFKEKVQTIYIDPPFNTGDDFEYVDRFQDSTWLSLIYDRLKSAKYLLLNNGSIFLHLDRNADYYGRFLLQDIFESNSYKNDIIWKYFVSGKYPNEFAKDHDRILFYAKTPNSLFNYEKEIDSDLYYEKKAKGETVIKDGVEYYVYNGELRTFEKQIGETWNINKVKRDGRETFGFNTQKPEDLLKRIVKVSSQDGSIVLDYFLGIGTTIAVAHKMRRKWIGIEIADHFNTMYIDQTGAKKIGIVGRMKEVLAGQGNHEPCGISKEVNWQGGGFFKYYELEQYEESLNNCKYEDGGLFTVPGRSQYQEYVFMKDEKMLKALEIDYENDKVNVDLSQIYPNIDIAETLSNLTGKWIKKITPCLPEADTPLQEENNTPSANADTPLREGNYEVEFEDGTKINTKDLDYKLIKPLIWWE
jgi:adenine specific DNA methylase Mod